MTEVTKWRVRWTAVKTTTGWVLDGDQDGDVLQFDTKGQAVADARKRVLCVIDGDPSASYEAVEVNSFGQEVKWEPPFEGVGIEDMECPHCNEEGLIYNRKQEKYKDGEYVDAYCEGCHALLRVKVYMEPHFGEVRVVKSGSK